MARTGNSLSALDRLQGFANVRQPPNRVLQQKGGTTDDILVKVLLNEHEVHIPVATTQFPYYRWTDVRAYYANVVGM